jgi:flagellar assembly protein FliH
LPEQRIIARAATAGTRRLQVVPLQDPLDPTADGPGGNVTVDPPLSGLNAFLAAAQQQGAELVSAARVQADQIASDARASGYETGYAEGVARAEQELQDLFRFAEGAVREIAETRTRMLEEAEQDLVELALQVAGKVLQTQLEADPHRVADVLRGALRKAYVRDHVQVVCNPEDLALIEAASADLQAHVGTLRNLELIGDRRVTRGGVLVRTPGGDVDATLQSQLERLRDAMLGGHG